jgi:hypothetical protein
VAGPARRRSRWLTGKFLSPSQSLDLSRPLNAFPAHALMLTWEETWRFMGIHHFHQRRNIRFRRINNFHASGGPGDEITPPACS